MNVQQILSLIPASKLESLAIETNVNHKVKKLDGAVLFKLLAYSMLQVKHNSLRTMETIFNSYAFGQLHPPRARNIKGSR